MIGLDTNVLLRIFVSESSQDETRARTFVASRKGKGAFFVPKVVLLEIVWALRSRYRYPRAAIASVVSSLLASDEFVVEDREIIEASLLLEEEMGADFADAVIALGCRAAGCERTVTLDVRAAKALPGMELIP